MVGDKRRSHVDGQMEGKLTSVSERESWNKQVKLRLLKRTVGKKTGTQRDKRGFGRGLSDRHFVHIQSRKTTPRPPSRGTPTPVTLGYALTLSPAVGQ